MLQFCTQMRLARPITGLKAPRSGSSNAVVRISLYGVPQRLKVSGWLALRAQEKARHRSHGHDAIATAPNDHHSLHCHLACDLRHGHVEAVPLSLRPEGLDTNRHVDSDTNCHADSDTNYHTDCNSNYYTDYDSNCYAECGSNPGAHPDCES
jgi:hypothetical protein